MIEFFSLEIRWYAFIIVSAILISVGILYLLLKNEEELDFEFYLDYLIITIPAAVISARIYYVIFKLDYYSANPVKILAINEGGLAIHGALIMGAAVLYFMCKKRNKSFLRAVDYLVPLTAFSQALGRWGNFVNQEAYGKIVSENYYNYFPEFIKKQMLIEGHYREATFFYESAANFILFIFLLFYLKSERKKNGEIFSLYLIFYSLYRFFIEEKRTDSLLIADFQVAKLLSLILIFFGIALIIFINMFRTKE